MSSENLMEEILTKWSCLTYNRTLVTHFMQQTLPVTTENGNLRFDN